MRRVLASAALALMAGTAHAAPAPEGLTVDRVVIVMRHGVRPPTKAQPMPAGVTPETWPSWPVEPGFLTPHGALAVERLGASDSAALRAQGVIPAKGCPTVRIVADSDQRTIETAKSWAKTFAPGCDLPSDHQPQGSKDPASGPSRPVWSSWTQAWSMPPWRKALVRAAWRRSRRRIALC